jgi:hypothetical protein
MVGVVFVFVSDDASEAEALADAFDDAGYPISGADAVGEALSIVVWSRAALRSSAFRNAAARALHSDRVIVASLIAPPDRARVLGAPVVDLSAWSGEDDRALDPLLDAAHGILYPAQPSVIALPPSDYEDAEFVEHSAPVLSQAERVERAMRAWEAPIPTEMLRPPRQRVSAPEAALELVEIVDAGPEKRAKPRPRPAPTPRDVSEQERVSAAMARIAAEMARTEADNEPDDEPDEQPKRKRGVANPRHDYRRAQPPRQPNSRAPGAIALGFVVLVGVSALTTRLNMPPAPATSQFDLASDASMSLTTVTAGASELEDYAPEERPPLFEPRPYAEPASATSGRRTVRRARRAAPSPEAMVQHAAYVPQRETSSDQAEPVQWQIPVLIPEAIVAELDRATDAASDAATNAATAVAQPLAELSGGL